MAAVTARPQSTTWRGLIGWVMFDWATQPFYTLVLTFLFAPYFAATFIGDATRGQEIWGYTTAAAGLIVAFLSPVLGSIADASGRRKPWIAVTSIPLVAGLCGLWLAAPGAENLAVVLFAVIVATVAVEFITVFTNAMMPSLVPPGQLGRLSGIGWATGYVGGLVSLVIATGLIVADGTTGKTMLGLDPIIPLDTSAYEGDRLIGPFSALWYAVFVLPLFLFTPDRARRKSVKSKSAVVREGLLELKETITNVRQYANIVRFLVARMFYADGLGAIFAFGGVYAAGQFGWTATELGLFGIILTVTAGIGASIGGALDDKRGARTVILGGLIVLLFGCAGVLSVDRTHILYWVEVQPPAPGGGIFSGVGEQVYILFAAVIGIVAGPIQASSRSLLARISPPEMSTKFFGLFAFSGKVTSFASPLAVGVVTGLSGSQRVGIAAVSIFLVMGLLFLLTVREERQNAQA
ncbi:MAG: MFS transporter [Methyloligellaceae bacterium]